MLCSLKVRVLFVSLRVATCLVHGRVCVTGLVVWINVHRRSVCVWQATALGIISGDCGCHSRGTRVLFTLTSERITPCISLLWQNSVEASWIALLLRDWKVPDWNFDPDTDCPYWGLLQFFSVLPRKYSDNEKLTRCPCTIHEGIRGVEV